MMLLKLNAREMDGVIVIDMIGRLTCGDPQMLLRETVRRFADEGNRKLVLNLSDVDVVDSSGLAEMIATRHFLMERGGRVNLLGLRKRVKNLLVMTGLLVVFESYDEESKAVTALQNDRKPEQPQTETLLR